MKNRMLKLTARMLTAAMCVSILPTTPAVYAQEQAVKESTPFEKESGIDVWTETSNENVFREDVKENDASTEVNLSAVKNEFESAQIVLRGDKNFKIESVSFTDLKNGEHTISADNLKYNFVEYEWLDKNSAGQNASTVVKKAPGYFPDALSNETSIDVEKDSTQPVWVRAYVPKDAVAGVYTGTASVKTSEGTCEVPVNVSVYDATIPDAKDAEFSFSFWSNLAATWDLEDDKDGISVLYGYEKYSEDWWALMENIAQIMKDNRSNDLLINIPALLKDGGTYVDENGDYVFNWSKFDEYIEFFADRGVVKRLEGYAILMCVYGQTYRVAILDDDGNGGVTRATVDYDTEKGQKWLRQLIPALCDHLEEKGWDKMWMQHIGDEPFNIEPQTSKWQAVRDMFRAENQNIKCGDPYDNTGCTTAMVNMDADIFFPILSVHEEQLDIYDDLKAKGKEVFMYTCLNPQGNYLNRYVDKPVWQMKTIGWLSYKRDISGHLHWGLNEWLKYDTKIYHTINMQNYKGDNFTIYPDVDLELNEKGEVTKSVPRRPEVKSSIRYEAVRDSCEDYEIFKLLEKRDESLAKEIAGTLVENGYTYETDTDVMAAQRERLLQETAMKGVSATFDQQTGDVLGQVKVTYEGLAEGHALYYNPEVTERDPELTPLLAGKDKPEQYSEKLTSGQEIEWGNDTYLNIIEVDANGKVVAYTSIQITESKVPMATEAEIQKPISYEMLDEENQVRFTFKAVEGENLVQNPGFEQGEENWRDTNYFEVVDGAGVDRSKAAQIGFGEGGCSQNLTLYPGVTYTVEAEGRVSKEGEKGWVTVETSNGNENIFEFVKTEYEKMMADVTISENATAGRVYTWKNASNYGGLDDAYLYADNISVKSKNVEVGEGHMYYYSDATEKAKAVQQGASKPAEYGNLLLSTTELTRKVGEYLNVVEVDKTGKVVAQTAVKVEEPEEVSKKTLEHFLNKAKELKESGAADDLIESVKKLLDEAIAEGEAVMADENATKDQVTSATIKLIQVIHASDMKAGDKTDLAMALELTTMIDLNDYVEAGQAEYLAAIEKAEAVMADGDAFPKEIDESWNALVEAIENLRLKADKSALEDLLNSVEGLDLSKYTEESVKVYKNALAVAKAVMADETLSEDDQKKVDDVKDALKVAKDALVAKSEAPETPDDGNDDENANGGNGIGTGENKEDSDKADDKKEGTNAPKTGDGTALPLMMVLSVAAGAVILTKKKNEENPEV